MRSLEGNNRRSENAPQVFVFFLTYVSYQVVRQQIWLPNPCAFLMEKLWQCTQCSSMRRMDIKTDTSDSWQCGNPFTGKT